MYAVLDHTNVERGYSSTNTSRSGSIYFWTQKLRRYCLFLGYDRRGHTISYIILCSLFSFTNCREIHLDGVMKYYHGHLTSWC